MKINILFKSNPKFMFTGEQNSKGLKGLCSLKGEGKQKQKSNFIYRFISGTFSAMTVDLLAE